MTALYDHVLKMISNGLGKCIAFLDRCQQHSKKSNSSCDTHKAFSEDDLNTAICHCYQITSDCQAVFFKIKNQLKADTKNKALVINRIVTLDDLLFCLNTATKYSPWTSASITQGFITSAGGHRI
ncbi:MAG: hypothetical protein IIY06_10915, partial [Proteobacteria bacterium]|nr:hypothetical protein [Pseudomonadota bacterium]